MHFDILHHYPQVIGVLSVLGIIGLLFLADALHDHFDARMKVFIAELEKEESHIETLPDLDTRFLLRIPTERWDVDRRRAGVRTFHVYHAYLLIYDQNGDGWIGFIMPETLESLRAGEYVQREYHVPIRGRGQKLFGDPIFLDGCNIDVYPIWMTGRTDVHEWHIWMHLEDEFNKLFSGKNYEDAFRKILPPATLRRFRDRRARYHQLRASVDAHHSIRA
jgi:hypothetical protein